MKILYEATTTANSGRSGRVKSNDGPLDYNLSTPKEMGGDGGSGVNTEQFFGAVYTACFGVAIQQAIFKKKLKI